MECWKCKHRREVPGSCHSACFHQKVTSATSWVDLLGDMMGILEKVRENPLGIGLDPVGVKGGWASWPFDFDPIWVTQCSGMELK